MAFGSLDKTALLLNGLLQARREGGDSKNAETSIRARFYHRQSEKRLFFVELSGTAGHDLDLDVALVRAAREAGATGYTQRRIAGATLDFPGQEAQLLAVVRGWLHANTPGTRAPR